MGGFDFGAFLGGMGEQISTNIEDAKKFNREKDFRLELLGEEEATKMRLKKADEKKAQRIKDAELAGRLKALNFDAPRSAYIMANGTGYAEEMLLLGAQAHVNGLDPNTMLKYADGIEDMREWTGKIGEGTPQFPEGFDYTSAFVQDVDIMTSVRTPKSDELDTIKKMRANAVAKMSKHEVGSDLYNEYQKEAKFFLDQMVLEAADIEEAKQKSKGDDGDKDPELADIFSSSDVNGIFKLSADGLAPKYNFVSFEAALEGIETGQQAASQILRMDAALDTMAQAASSYDNLPDKKKEFVYNNVAKERMNAIIETSIIELKNLANDTYQASLVTPDGDLGKLHVGEYTDGYFDANGNKIADVVEGSASGGIFKTAEQQATENRTLKRGNTVLINGEVAIYTGFLHTYGNWEEGGVIPKLRFVFENSSDDKYMPTLTTRN